MKKIYTKPEILFEDFTMSASIAVGCEIHIDNQAQGNCGYKYEGGFGQTLFTETAGSKVCNVPVDDDVSNGFCYHVPTDLNNLFNS